MTLDLVPTIDLAQAEQGLSELLPLDTACRDHGFFLLKNHGIQDVVDDMWAAGEEFFGQSTIAKRKIMRTQTQPLGYYDRELTKQQRDLKEVFDFMKPRAGHRDINQWPDSTSFRAVMIRFFDASSTVAERTLALLYRAITRLQIDSAELPAGDPRTSTVRLNYYPLSDPLSTAEQTTTPSLGAQALGQHTDPGVLTLLLQDDTGGLQTYSLKNGWIDIQPSPGSIVVNLGDAMQVWTNDTYKAALHRVRPVHKKARFSTPYFFNPGNDAVLKPLTQLSDGPAVYQSFKWRDYIKARVEDNYSDLGEDDIQIDRFRRQT